MIKELVLVSGKGCGLCRPVKYVLDRYITRYNNDEVGGGGFKLSLKEIDIHHAGNEHLHSLYRYDIPLVFLDDVEISRHSLSEDILHSHIKQLEESQSQSQSDINKRE